MIIFQADNRIILRGSKYSYTNDNYSSGYTSPYSIANTIGMAANDYVLIGNIGSESAEILKISVVDSTNNTITFKDDNGTIMYPKFAHPESTRVTIIPYNKVRYFWSPSPADPVPPVVDPTDPSFDNATGLPVNTITFYDLDVSQIYSTYSDETHSTGYGWFLFYNSHTLIYSQPSNAIPYSGFQSNTLQKILDSFFSLLSNKESKLITISDATQWATEGFNNISVALNLVNVEANASTPVTITTCATEKEYLLPSDFNDIISVNYGTVPVNKISIKDVDSYSGDETVYYVRNKYIGFCPTPDNVKTYTYRYNKLPTDLSLYSDKIQLPDNGVSLIKFYMLAMAYMKLTNEKLSSYYLGLFDNKIKELKMSACNRDGGLDSWGIQSSSNV